MREASTPVPRCMWCSAVLPSDTEITCPTCGATLIGDGADQVPGVTAIDAVAIIRGRGDPRPQRRSRLMSWISGEYPDEEKPAPPGSLAPPSADVRREMLRLELEAEVANLQAEAGAIAAEQAVEAVDAGATPEAAAADAAAVLAVANEAVEHPFEMDPAETAATAAATASATVHDDVVTTAPDIPADADATAPESSTGETTPAG